MSKYVQSWLISSMALSLALLLSLIQLAACGTGADTRNPLSSTLKKQPGSETAWGDESAQGTGMPVTIAPDTTGKFDCTRVNQIPSIECEALVALYNSTNGPDWADNSGWLATITPCTWSGVECTGGHVSYISLSYNQLTGFLPPELGNLSHLRVLGLLANSLRGPIPPDIGNLSELVSIEMSCNQLTGPLPVELGDLPKLRNLSLGYNKLSGLIPPALGNIWSLQTLVLSHNQLSGAIPVELGNLVQLYSLYLSHNRLSGVIPTSLGRLSQLSELDLSYNQLSGPVPESVAQISGRSLWGNQLEGTITASSQAPVVVDFKGIHFTADPSLAVSIWPELIMATPVVQGEPYWFALPEHMRFTFANPDLSSGRSRMGINLATEGQILIYPLAELSKLNPLVQVQIEKAQSLLVNQKSVPEDDLPLLPLNNASQVFHAQAKYLEFNNIQGLRFLTQYTQESRPVINNQELFYTFQGITNDQAWYVAAFFPVTTANLPDKLEAEKLLSLDTNFDNYISGKTAILEQLLPAEFTPNLTILDAVVTSLRLPIEP